MAPGQDANSDNLGKSFSIFYIIISSPEQNSVSCSDGPVLRRPVSVVHLPSVSN